MKQYLVAGGARFMGSLLAYELTAFGHRVLALDAPSTGSTDNATFLLACLDAKAQVLQGVS
jgi:nucleoside-diphosphate-sugar epimerase